MISLPWVSKQGASAVTLIRMGGLTFPRGGGRLEGGNGTGPSREWALVSLPMLITRWMCWLPRTSADGVAGP